MPLDAITSTIDLTFTLRFMVVPGETDIHWEDIRCVDEEGRDRPLFVLTRDNSPSIDELVRERAKALMMVPDEEPDDE